MTLRGVWGCCVAPSHTHVVGQSSRRVTNTSAQAVPNTRPVAMSRPSLHQHNHISFTFESPAFAPQVSAPRRLQATPGRCAVAHADATPASPPPTQRRQHSSSVKLKLLSGQALDIVLGHETITATHDEAADESEVFTGDECLQPSSLQPAGPSGDEAGPAAATPAAAAATTTIAAAASNTSPIITYDEVVAMFWRRINMRITEGSDAGHNMSMHALQMDDDLASACADALAAHFRSVRHILQQRGADNDATIPANTTRSLFEQFVRMPAAVVELLLTRSNLAADSEDAVVSLLHHWMVNNLSAADNFSQLRRTLGACIRACQLADAYLQSVMSKQDCMFWITDEDRALLSYVKALGAQFQPHENLSGVTGAGLQALPRNWLNMQPRPQLAAGEQEGMQLRTVITREGVANGSFGITADDTYAESSSAAVEVGSASSDDAGLGDAAEPGGVDALGYQLSLAVQCNAEQTQLMACLAARPTVLMYHKSAATSYWVFDVTLEVHGLMGCMGRFNGRLASVGAAPACVPLFTFPPEWPMGHVASWDRHHLFDDRDQLTVTCTVMPVRS